MPQATVEPEAALSMSSSYVQTGHRVNSSTTSNSDQFKDEDGKNERDDIEHEKQSVLINHHHHHHHLNPEMPKANDRPSPSATTNNINSTPTTPIVGSPSTTTHITNSTLGTNNNNKNNGSTTKKPASSNAKLNGLKNRIIPRPPPLILDKISDFSLEDHQPSHPLLYNNHHYNDPIHFDDTARPIANNQASLAAKQKFWASLSESRNVGALARQSNMSSLSKTHSNVQPISSFGADLIVTNRSSLTTNNIGPSKTRDLIITSNPPDQTTTTTSDKNSSDKNFHDNRTNVYKISPEDNDIGSGVNDNKCHEVSNGSEHDDSSAHGGNISESGGGNLIGVDNPTPPASAGGPIDEEQAPGDTQITDNVRSRSNNPFLTTDDGAMSIVGTHNNFHRRPASFMAATGASSQCRTPVKLVEGVSIKSHLSSEFGSMRIAEDGNDVRTLLQDNVDRYNQISDVRPIESITSPRSVANVSGGSDISKDPRFSMMPLDTGYNRQYPGHFGHNNSSLQSYDTVYPSSNHISHDGTISAESANAISNPPPSATLPLPHWTEAIYELNNATLDPESVGGGAENGQMIYIVKNGDIILELDQIKVSGFTLVEFNELVDSKSTHLLSAVQTKHSHSLTPDLKRYLSSSFPKNSPDKKLQDLIRENIYRRTIPCTTRPPKNGEVDKIDYHFLSREQFLELDKQGLLIESGVFSGHYYGTMRPSTEITSMSLNRVQSHSAEPEHSEKQLNFTGLSQSDNVDPSQEIETNPLYENYQQMNNDHARNHIHGYRQSGNQPDAQVTHSSLSENSRTKSDVHDGGLPSGWEEVVDQTHGIFYVDHNTQRTQYERPYEIELVKSYMGFGFTLIEADNGLLLVRSIIPGGPAHLNSSIRPGDILISAMGIPVSGLQHIDVAKLFSTFAVGDRVKLTFARGGYLMDANFVPDEYLFSNGTNGDMALASNTANRVFQNGSNIDSNMMISQDFDTYTIPIPPKPTLQYAPDPQVSYQNNFYANNEEIAMQRLQRESLINGSVEQTSNRSSYHDSNAFMPHLTPVAESSQAHANSEIDDHEYFQINLDRESTDSNWGIRLIGGAEVNRAISIGSVVFGGAASKNGQLKSGDEIISINGIDVVGSTHQYVVGLISSCKNRASLVVRRKKFAEACEVVLNRNMEEGFGFVIISSGNCALIGTIIAGSPADRCQQLHIRDRIIAVNGRNITPGMQHPEIVNMIKESGSTLRLRIVPADCYSVELIKSGPNDSFGFRMRGGSEYDGMPLYILKVSPNGLARDLLNVGDQIIEINGIPTVGMTHQQAASIIKHSDPIVKLKLRRNYVTPPSLLVDSPRALQKFNQVTAEMKPVSMNLSQNCLNDGSSASSDFGSMSQPSYTNQPLVDQQRLYAPSNDQIMHGQNMALYAT